MTRVSRSKLSDGEWQRVWQRLVKVIVEAGDRKRVEVLLSGLLTPAEEIMIAKRLMVGILIRSGWRVPDICRALKMSKATVYKLQTLFAMNHSYRAFLYEVMPEKIEFKSGEGKEEGSFLEDVMDVIFEGYHDRWNFMDPRGDK